MITLSTSSVLPLLKLAALAPALLLGQPGESVAQSQSQTYQRRDACIEAGLLDAARCEFAYRNARAEFEQAVPRYASRGLCERSHGRCGAQVSSAGGWDSFGRGGATYVPRFVGIRVSGTGSAIRVVPVVEGRARLAYQPRPVDALSDAVGGRRAVLGLAATRSRPRAAPQGEDAPQSGAPYAKRGDRDDTVRVPMEQKSIGADVAPGLYVDPDGVEWYKPAPRR